MQQNIMRLAARLALPHECAQEVMRVLDEDPACALRQAVTRARQASPNKGDWRLNRGKKVQEVLQNTSLPRLQRTQLANQWDKHLQTVTAISGHVAHMHELLVEFGVTQP